MIFFSSWETFAKKRYEQGFLQAYAESHGGLQALEDYYAEQEGRDPRPLKAPTVHEEREAQAKRISELEKEIAHRTLLIRLFDALDREVEERKSLAKRVAGLEKQIRQLTNNNGTTG